MPQDAAVELHVLGVTADVGNHEYCAASRHRSTVAAQAPRRQSPSDPVPALARAGRLLDSATAQALQVGQRQASAGDVEELDDVLRAPLEQPVEVPEREALATAREFGRRGLGIGPSSGLNIAAACRLAARLGPGHHVATVLPDRMERYFSTALFDDVAAEL
jgi:hypothetical protein